jgi:hypothetical protein
MIITKEWVDIVTPNHGRTSCDDNNLANSFGGWNGKYNRNTGKKEIDYPRCNRCYLLDHIGENTEDLEFEITPTISLSFKPYLSELREELDRNWKSHK